MKRIGVLTSGGDTPGMNAAIRAIVKTAFANGISVMGIIKGYAGLIEGRVHEMREQDVEGIVGKGGTVLKTARSPEFKTPEGFAKAIQVIKAFSIDGMVVIGGDGSFKGAQSLSAAGIPTIGLPGTIDNDLPYTDYSIGFFTAVNGVVDDISRIRDTMISHERIGVIEVMGNQCGDIALHAGLAGGVEYIIVPEVEFDVDKLCDQIMMDRIKGKMTSIVVIAEGAGKGEPLATYIKQKTGFDVKAVVLGYIQRGGDPTPFDRILATRMGVRAVELLSKGKGNRVVGIKNNSITDLEINEALAIQERFDRPLYDMSVMLSTN
jgi:6-phosphofructokinase 1